MCEGCNRSSSTFSRRSLLLGGLSLASAAALPRFAVAQEQVTPDAALQRLLDGNARYVAGAGQAADYSANRAARALSQHPIAAILSCSDSRVSPELAFDQGPGDLFVVRVAGNFVNDDGLASIEYAVRFLQTPLIVVLGHSNCGAVDAAIKVIKEGAELPGHLPEMIRDIKPAAEAAIAKPGDDLLATAVIENIKRGVARLETAEPIVAGLVASGSVRVVGAHYELTTGAITLV